MVDPKQGLNDDEEYGEHASPKEKPFKVPGIYKKLSEIQGQLSVVGKSGKNTFQKYDYATEGDFLEALRPLCAEKGICISTSAIPERTETGRFDNNNKTTRFAVVCVRTTLTDSEDGSNIIVEMPGYAEDTGDKAIYKALTGATKYAVWKAFNLATGEDPENDAPKSSAAKQVARTTTPVAVRSIAPSAALGAAPTQNIEVMTIEQLYEEFKVRCKTNNLKPAEMFKKLMGDELQPGMTFVTLSLEKARALVLDVVPF